MAVPSDRKYSEQHEWLVIDGDAATIGITAFAADALGDVVYNLDPYGKGWLFRMRVSGAVGLSDGSYRVAFPAVFLQRQLDEDAVPRG